MKVAIYTLCRDRLEYSKNCFDLLRRKAGYEFDHYVVDNGSQDGTVDWLLENQDQFTDIILNLENVGLSVGSNQALEMIVSSRKSYDLVARMDNDCECISDNVVAQMIKVYENSHDQPMLLSPHVTGINHQPIRGRAIKMGGHPLSYTGHIGGLFHWLNANIYLNYRFPTDIAKAKGDDSALCKWVHDQGWFVGYVEDVIVHHTETTDGQALRYPEYFTRKREEETIGIDEKVS